MGPIGELLGKPLGWIMYWIYEVVNNYGLSIIIFTLITKIILFPTAYKQQLGTARMSLLNPKLNKIRKQYANNQQKMAEEQQKLYQEEGINPMGSCLPLIISMILLYGVLDVVYRPLSHILRISSGTLDAAKQIITDNNLADKYFKTRPELTILSRVKENPDLFSSLGSDFTDKVCHFKNTFLGVDLGVIPTIHPDVWNKAAVALVMIPILSGLIQLIFTIYSQHKSKQMNPDMPNMGAMKAVMFIMPVFSVWLAFAVPAGVGFYWIWSSLFSLIQSIGLYAYFSKGRTLAINEKLKEKNKDKKPGFMQRMMEQQSELMKQQEQAKKGGRADYNADTEGMSKSERSEYNRQLINEARKRMAEKYGEEYTETSGSEEENTKKKK